MTRGRRSQILLWVLCGILLLWAGLTLAWVYLPAYAEHRLIPRLVAEQGWGPLGLEVRRLGLGGVDLSDLVLGDPQAPAMTADTLRADFSLRDLKAKRIRRLSLSGAQLHLRITDQGFELPGLTLTGPKAAAPPAKNESERLLPAFPLDELRITQSRVELQWNDHILRVPLDLQVQSDPGDPARLRGRLNLLPWGRRVSLTGRLEGEPPRLALEFESEPLPLAPMAALIRPQHAVELQGEGSLKGTLMLDPTNFKIAEAQVRLQVHHPSGLFGATPVSLSPLTHSPSPIAIELHCLQGNWRMEGSPLRVVDPLPLDLTHWQLSYFPNAESPGWRLSATLSPRWNQILAPWGVAFPKPSALPLQVEAHYPQDGSWQVRLAALSPPRLTLGLPEQGLALKIEPPAIALSARGTETGAAGEYQIQLPGWRVQSPDIQCQIGETTLSGRITWHPGATEGALSADYQLKAGDSKVNFGSTKAHFPNIALQGLAGIGKNGKMRTEGQTTFSKAKVSDPLRKIEFRELSGVLPYTWPLENKIPPGNLTVGKAHYQQIDLGRATIRLQPAPGRVDLQGSLSGALLPQMQGKISGRLAHRPMGAWGGGVELTVDLPVSEAVSLGQWLPAAQGQLFQGGIEAHLDLRLDGGHATAGADLKVENGNLENGDSAFQLRGIAMELKFPDLFALRSAPAQVFQFEALTAGRLTMEAGKIIFQIEPGPSLFVEEGRFQWCGGRVFSGPLRIGQDPDLGVDLFCDRLRMAPLLAQIGDFEAQGQGTLNGRIPLRWQDGKLRFEDGFLYSSPGEEGRIRLTGTEILTATLPAGTPQANQVEVAREALKDYSYTWAKLELNSEGEELAVGMKLDGRPAANLPFIFDQEFGGFLRVGPDHAGSKFEGIRLDLNFKLPLDRLLGQYETFQRILTPQ